MTCYHPIVAYRGRDVNPETGKRCIVFNPTKAFPDRVLARIDLPCGQCIGCRLERSRQWAMRCVHEASLYEHNCYITLTYANEHLPKDGSLDVREYQLFMKRLRKKCGNGIRFFHCGEYGEEYQRPHYHACLFNYDFPDRVFWKLSNGIPLYISDTLSELWPFGWSTVGDVTFESAAYVARYITKKVTGDKAEHHYQGRKPEYITMSRRPGIARAWFDRYKSDVFPDDFVVMRDGKKLKPPKYYDRVYEFEFPDEFAMIKSERKLSALKNAENNTPVRLLDREEVQYRKLVHLKRGYENDC